MQNKRRRTPETISRESVDGFFMRHLSAAVEGEEWEGYSVTVTFTGRKISRGFEMRSVSVAALKTSNEQTKQGG